MSELNTEPWEKELRALLDQIQSQPSRDATTERERIVILKNLIAKRDSKAA